MQAFATREGIKYKVLWESEDFLNIPISSHKRVNNETKNKIQKSFLKMTQQKDGLEILKNSGLLIKQEPPYGFKVSNNNEYKNYITTYKKCSFLNKDY